VLISKRQVALLLVTSLFFTACVNQAKSKPKRHRLINISGKSESFNNGASDGCRTAISYYTKDHRAFNRDIEYNKGWWAGRRNCEGYKYNKS